MNGRIRLEIFFFAIQMSQKVSTPKEREYVQFTAKKEIFFICCCFIFHFTCPWRPLGTVTLHTTPVNGGCRLAPAWLSLYRTLPPRSPPPPNKRAGGSVIGPSFGPPGGSIIRSVLFGQVGEIVPFTKETRGLGYLDVLLTLGRCCPVIWGGGYTSM